MAVAKQRFVTTGMHCPSCSMLIQMEVGDLEGVTAVEADHRTQVVDVDFDADVVSPQDIISAIVRLGYGVEDGES